MDLIDSYKSPNKGGTVFNFNPAINEKVNHVNDGSNIQAMRKIL